MASTDTLKQLNIEVNDTQASDVKENLKQFLANHETIVETKKQLDPLFTEIVSDESIADKIESSVNKEHIKNLMVAMKNEFSADGSNYKAVYEKRGKAITFGLQSALRIMWYDIWNEQIDARYGDKTATAVMLFQQINNLSSVDGSAWVETFTALANMDLETKITDEQKNIIPVKKKKAKDNAVKNKETPMIGDNVDIECTDEADMITKIWSKTSWSEKQVYSLKVEWKWRVYYGNGRVNIGGDWPADMHNWEIKDGKVLIDGKLPITIAPEKPLPVNDAIDHTFLA